MKEQMIINAGAENKICGASKKKSLLFVLSRCRGWGRRINGNGECKVVHQIAFDLHSPGGRAPVGSCLQSSTQSREDSLEEQLSKILLCHWGGQLVVFISFIRLCILIP